MINRCTWENFFVGLPIAFFSGLGVAVSLLDEQTNSLVGVAISASLLPPAVNAGMVWVAYGFFDRNRNADYYADVDDDFIHTVTKEDFRLGGVVSLLLTLANILLVVVASMLMFRLKEKLPIRKKVFWEVSHSRVWSPSSTPACIVSRKGGSFFFAPPLLFSAECPHSLLLLFMLLV